MKTAVLVSFLLASLGVASAAAVPLVDHAADGHHLDARKPATKKPAKPPAPAEPAPRPGSPSKPIPAKPIPVKPSPAKPTPAKPTPGTPAPGKPGKPSGKTCKQIVLLRQQEEEDDEEGSAVVRSLHSELSKRAFKGSKGPQGPCKVPNFISGTYESSGKEAKENPNAPMYGWKNLDVCTDLSWYKGDTSPAPKTNVKFMQTEHVLEWQTIEEFFGPYLEKHFATTQFTNPDPNVMDGSTRSKTKWCTAWSTSWTFTGQNKFALKAGGPEKTPFQWIADVYPSKEKYRNEFTLLQRGSNSVKGRLFNDDSIFTEADKKEKKKVKKGMTSLVKDEPRLAIARLRDVVGARKYLGDAKVRKFMGDVKLRLQTRFDELETALGKPENVREIAAQRGSTKGPRKVDVWVKRDLGKLWDVFMNNKWVDAKNKQQKFMEKWIMQIKNKHCTAAMIKALPKDKSKDTPQQGEKREVCADYTAMVRGWKDAQMSPFTAPWTGLKDPAGDRHTPPSKGV